jgi:hypothetical protein
MSNLKVSILAAAAALVLELAIWFLLLKGHVGADAPPDFFGWMGLLLCFPAILIGFLNVGGFMLGGFVVFVEHFVILWYLIRRFYGRRAQPDAAPNGGPAARSGKSGVGEGPPSVS